MLCVSGECAVCEWVSVHVVIVCVQAIACVVMENVWYSEGSDQN